MTVVGLVNTNVHLSRRGHDCQAFGIYQQMPPASFIRVGTSLGLHLSHICPRAPTTVGWQESAVRAKMLRAEMERAGSAAILLAAVSTVGAIYSSPINKAPTDSDTQADRGIIFIWYLAKAPLLKRLLSVNDNQLSFD